MIEIAGWDSIIRMMPITASVLIIQGVTVWAVLFIQKRRKDQD